jgi:hypothetical protein
MSSNKYFMIPFENVPASPTYTVWFATWSQDRPVLEPNMNPPMVVGVTSDETLPTGAVLLGDGSKDPPPPPPPPPPLGLDYEASFTTWLMGDRDEDE